MGLDYFYNLVVVEEFGWVECGGVFLVIGV